MRKRAVKHSLVTISLGVALRSAAQLIDFETTPGGGTPIDNARLRLNDSYAVGNVDVSFGFDQDNDGTSETEAVFEQTGPSDPQFGFQGCPVNTTANDTADPGFENQLGDFFLRQPVSLQALGTFVVEYSGSEIVTTASGEIWDIDGPSNATKESRFRAATHAGADETRTRALFCKPPEIAFVRGFRVSRVCLANSPADTAAQ